MLFLSHWFCASLQWLRKAVSETATSADSNSISSSIAKQKWPAGVALNSPGATAFTKSTMRWSIYEAPTYAFSLSPTTEQEVADIVKVAKSAKIPFLATGGRHGFTTTLGKLQNGLSIDLSHMKTLEIDSAAQTVTVGPGIKIGDVISPIFKAGFEMPVGSCPEVSVIGATVGAGVGPFQGLFGLMIDALESVRLVTANGDIVNVSTSKNPDLFYAIRGAGSNFGIITSATFKLSKAVNGGQVFTADMIYPEHLKSGYFDALKSFENTMPAELAVNTTITWNPDSNSTQVVASFVYSGPEAEARKVLAPFFDLNPPVARTSVESYDRVPYAIVFGMVAAMNDPGAIHDVWTANVRQFSVESLNYAFEKYDAFYKTYPDGRASVGILESFSNQAVRASTQDTSYPWRDSKGNFMFHMSWPELGNPVEGPANALAKELRDHFGATSGYPSLSVYVSYAHGDEELEDIYGASLPRLVDLKKKWDPDNVFGYNNALPTRLPLPSSRNGYTKLE